MATYTTALHDEGAATAFADEGSAQLYDRYTVATALATNDVIRSVYIPKNCVLLDAHIVSADLDTHATPTITLTLRVNDGSTQKNFFAASTVGQAGGVARADAVAGALGYEVTSAAFYLELLVAAGAATGATAVDIVMFVSYTNRRINADL